MNILFQAPYYDSGSETTTEGHYSATKLPRATMKVSIENGNQIDILITSSVSTMIATVAVALRIIAKCIGFGFDRSDLCILTALVWPNTLW